MITLRVPPPLRAGLMTRAARGSQRLRAARHQVVSAAMLILGLAAALAGGALIGRWCLGLVLIAEAAGLVAVGLLRDDGVALPRRGARTVAEVLDEERIRP